MLLRLHVAVLAAVVSFAMANAGAQALTLPEAWRIAEERNPALRSAAAAVHGAQGQLAESRSPLWNNPEASLEGSRTRIPQAEERYRGWTLGLSQTLRDRRTAGPAARCGGSGAGRRGSAGRGRARAIRRSGPTSDWPLHPKPRCFRSGRAGCLREQDARAGTSDVRPLAGPLPPAPQTTGCR